MTKKTFKIGKILSYHLILQPEPEGGFTVIVPALPGCVTFGKTLKEAKTMAKDAIEGFLEVLMQQKEPIPSDEDSVISTIQIKTPHKTKTVSYA
jgi:predicted RNase H-like HicB family nuclease